MKLISLNTYGGRLFEPIMAFIEKHKADTDVFYFQEIYSNPKENIMVDLHEPRVNLFEELSRALGDFTGHIAIAQDDYEIKTEIAGCSYFGLSTFVKTSLQIVDVHEFFLCNGRNTFIGNQRWDTMGYNALAITMDINGTPLTVVNLHGNALPAHKLDDPIRDEQTRRVLEFCKQLDGEIVICGDFNSLPHIESIRAFERNGFRDLVKEFEIKTTRGSMMRKLFPQYEHGSYGFQEFADYTFVTPGVTVESFEVPDEPISDHLPMILECTV